MSVLQVERKPQESLFIMVGDMSADKHVAHLVKKLREERPDLRIWGAGGPEMRAQGFEALWNSEDFALVGIIELIRHGHFLYKLGDTVLAKIIEEAPDAVLLVDYGGFNLRLATRLRKRFASLPILYFISPQVWGSRPWRMNALARAVTKMLVIFPFEEDLYRRKGIPAKFVGHPLLKNLPDPAGLPERSELETRFNFGANDKLVSIFPGSRKSEINDLLPLTLEAIKQLLTQRSDIQFIISQASPKLASRIRKLIDDCGISHHLERRLHIVSSADNYLLMARSDLVWAKSGTTTLEVTLFGRPMLIFYRGMWLSYVIFLLFKRVKRVGWPNLLYGGSLVPELIQLDCRVDQLVRYTRDLLDVPTLRKEIADHLLALRSRLGQGDYAENCVREILSTIDSCASEPRKSQANV